MAYGSEGVVEAALVIVEVSLEELVAVMVVAVELQQELVAGSQAWVCSHHFYPLVSTDLKSQELFPE